MTGWEFDDVDRHDPLIQLRIPVTTTARWRPYLATFDRDSLARPTDAEAAMLASYIRFLCAKWNSPARCAEMLKKPLDLDPGVNTVMFHKFAEDAWGHHYDTWEFGPYWQTGGPHEEDPVPLITLLDRIGFNGWDGWKASQPHVFPQED